MKKWGTMTNKICTVCGVKKLDIWFTDKKHNVQCPKCYIEDVPQKTKK